MMLVMMATTAAALVMVVSRWRSPAHATLKLGRWSVLGRLDHFARAFPIAQVRVEETDLFFDCFDFVAMLGDNVFLDKLGPLELLATQRAQILLRRQLLRVHLDEL